MLIIGENKNNKGHKAARLEAGDVLTSRGACTFWLTTKHGLKIVTDKVGYPWSCGVLFLGGDGEGSYFCLDIGWVAGALKVIEDDAVGNVKISPLSNEGEAQDYVAKHGNKDPNFAHLRDLNNWTIYPEDQWRSI